MFNISIPPGSRVHASTSTGMDKATEATNCLPDKVVKNVLADFSRNIEPQLNKNFTAASDTPMLGLAMHHLFISTFLKTMDEAFQRNGVDLHKDIPANLNRVLRIAFKGMMNDPVNGPGKQAATKLSPDDFHPDANATLEFMHEGFRHTPMQVIPEKHLWRLCVNQNRVQQLGQLGIDMSHSALAPFLTDGEPRFFQSVLKALRFSMDHQDKRVNLDFIKNLHKKLNASGSSNMADPIHDGRNVNANLSALGSNKAAEFDTMSATGFNLLVEPGSSSSCAEEIRAFEKDVQTDLRRFKAEEQIVDGKLKFDIQRPFCAPKTLDKLCNRWLKEYHQALEDDPANGVRHAVVFCQNIGRLHGFQNGNGRLSHVLLNHLLSQQQANNPDPRLMASNGMVALSFKSILCSSHDDITASVKQAQLDFALLCKQENGASNSPPVRKSSPLQQAYLASRTS